MKDLTIFGDPDEGAVKQIENVMKDERAIKGALMADHHLGYSMPIGGVVAYENAVSPSGVGFDIACGNKAVRTDVLFADVQTHVPQFMETIQNSVEFGLGRRTKKPVDHELFDSPLWSEFDPDLKKKAREQLGTVGSGNHYVDLLVDEEGYVWAACHFGSRGFGHTVASGFLAIAAGKNFGDRVKESEDPAVLDIGTPAGDLYVEAMKLAGAYAYAGRNYVIEQVLDIIGANPTLSVHNHHNYAWQEEGLWVVRKGATPLTREPAFIGGSMGDISVIVRGTRDWPEGPAMVDPDTYEFWASQPQRVREIGALGSAPHGAGRVMSRTKAAGKVKRRKVYECSTRDCDFSVPANSYKPGKTQCPIHGEGGRFRRIEKEERIREGVVDWPQVKKDLRLRGITVLGSGADEAPEVYKDLMTVLNAHSNIEILHTLQPLGVVMAGSDVRDPYKD